ncbi:ER membrane protein DP1/Yop1 [Naganishia albida]|nr:ER membrane protein DP1/Yop1 [Naganishia albida]
MSAAQNSQIKAQQAGNQLLAHPFAQQAMAIANGQFKQLDRQLSQFPTLNNLEAQTKVPKVYGVLSMVGSFIFLIFFNLFGLASPVSNLIGWALPAYLSCGALESPGKDDDKQWLTYWVIFGLLNFLESAGLRVILYYLPFYFLFKTLFTIWLMLPSTRGAEVLWRTFVQPMYRQMAGRVNAQTPVTGYATNTASFEHIKTL